MTDPNILMPSCPNPECGVQLDHTNVKKMAPVHNYVMAACECECGAFFALGLDEEIAQAITEAKAFDVWLAMVEKRERDGRTVKGWRIELDSIDTPADMELMWNYQDTVTPGTVRRER